MRDIDLIRGMTFPDNHFWYGAAYKDMYAAWMRCGDTYALEQMENAILYQPTKPEIAQYTWLPDQYTKHLPEWRQADDWNEDAWKEAARAIREYNNPTKTTNKPVRQKDRNIPFIILKLWVMLGFMFFVYLVVSPLI